MSAIARVAAVVPLLVGPFDAAGQQVQPAARVYRIGLISPTPPIQSLRDAFRQQLRELGYVEGRNVVFEERDADGKVDRLPGLLAELIGLKVDVIVAGSTVSVLAAKRATTTIPIVFSSVFDPVGSGIVTSLARPGGNVTGVAIGASGEGMGGKWVQLVKDVSPGVSHVAVLWNSTNRSSGIYVREAQAAAQALKMKVDLVDAQNTADLDQALAAIGASGAQALIVTNDPFFHASLTQLVQFAASKRVPAVYFSRRFVDAGGLIGYGANFEDSVRRSAVYVDRIFKGAKPADLPVEQPTEFELVVNLKTARELGLAIPQRVLVGAKKIE